MVVPPEGNGSAVWCRLAVKGVPRLRFRDKGHRLADAVEGGARVRELRVVRTPLRTELHVVVRHPETEAPLVAPGNPVGIDVGLTHRLTLSDGHAVAPRKIDPSRVKRAQRKLSRAKKDSRTRGKKAHALAKAHRREKERAIQADFRLAHHLVTAYDGIAVENLNVAGMLKSKRFSKKMSEQRWSSLGNILEYKAEKAGIPYERVDPATPPQTARPAGTDNQCLSGRGCFTAVRVECAWVGTSMPLSTYAPGLSRGRGGPFPTRCA